MVKKLLLSCTEGQGQHTHVNYPVVYLVPFAPKLPSENPVCTTKRKNLLSVGTSGQLKMSNNAGSFVWEMFKVAPHINIPK